MLFAWAPNPERREDESFRKFWTIYPRKTGKLAAQKAYQKARKLASDQEILAGVERYIRNKPEYADWCMPTTFLNQGRWMDEPDTPTPTAGDWLCPHTPRCPHQPWCIQFRDAADARKRGEVEP